MQAALGDKLNSLFDPSFYLEHEDEIFARIFDEQK